MEPDGSGRNTESVLARSVVIFSPSEILPVVEATGFKADAIEKVFQLVKECRDNLSVVLPLTDSETEFLNLLLDKGEIAPSLLTSEKDMQDRISRHPLLEWKALNVREYKGR